MRRLVIASMVGALACLAGLAGPSLPTALGQNPAVSAADQKRQQICDALAVRAKSADDADAEVALVEAERLVNKEPWFYRRPAKPVVEALLAAKRYEPAERLARAIILGAPSDWWLVNNMQQYRIHAYLGQGKNDEALAAAKGLYNYSDFRQMAQAVDEVARVLTATDLEQGPARARRFKLQQQAWSETAPAEGDALGAPVLAGVKVDQQPFNAFFARPRHKDPYVAVMSEGLVLLLTDQPVEALKALREAESLATTDAQKNDLKAAIARAMRTQDQCIARANAYLATRITQVRR